MAGIMDYGAGFAKGLTNMLLVGQQRKDKLAFDQRQSAAQALQLMLQSGQVKDVNSLAPIFGLVMGEDAQGGGVGKGKGKGKGKAGGASDAWEMVSKMFGAGGGGKTPGAPGGPSGGE